jgi:hypothetical protein
MRKVFLFNPFAYLHQRLKENLCFEDVSDVLFLVSVAFVPIFGSIIAMTHGRTIKYIYHI